MKSFKEFIQIEEAAPQIPASIKSVISGMKADAKALEKKASKIKESGWNSPNKSDVARVRRNIKALYMLVRGMITKEQGLTEEELSEKAPQIPASAKNLINALMNRAKELELDAKNIRDDAIRAPSKADVKKSQQLRKDIKSDIGSILFQIEHGDI